MAAMAASLICCGVEKCGSPAPNSTRSAPAALSLAASATTAMVAEISIRLTRSLNCFTAGTVAISASLLNCCCAVEFFSQALVHQIRHQAAGSAAQPVHFLDQPRTQV